MVTIYTKYDPDIYSNIPKNYREQWARRTNMELTFTDEEIFNIWRDHYADDYESEGFKHYDDYVFDLMSDAISEKTG